MDSYVRWKASMHCNEVLRKMKRKRREQIIELVCGLCVLFARSKVHERRIGPHISHCNIKRKRKKLKWITFAVRASHIHLPYTHTHTHTIIKKHNINWVLINSGAFAWARRLWVRETLITIRFDFFVDLSLFLISHLSSSFGCCFVRANQVELNIKHKKRAPTITAITKEAACTACTETLSCEKCAYTTRVHTHTLEEMIRWCSGWKWCECGPLSARPFAGIIVKINEPTTVWRLKLVEWS